MSMYTQTGAIPLEVVAAITAALATVLEQPVGSFAITSIQPADGAAGAGFRPSPATAGVWAKSGLLEQHLARRQFGLRLR